MCIFPTESNSVSSDGHLCGLVATSAILEGDTREVCLDNLLKRQNTIIRATDVRVWPGTASVTYVAVVLYKGKWNGRFLLEDNTVSGITSFLTAPNKVVGKPYVLVANSGKSFNGSKIYGPGFVLTSEEAENLIERDRRNKDVDLSVFDRERTKYPSRTSTKSFRNQLSDWPLNPNSDDPEGSETPFNASNYPDCLNIVEERVKPKREILKDNPDGRKLKKYWWQYGRIRPGTIFNY